MQTTSNNSSWLNDVELFCEAYESFVYILDILMLLSIHVKESFTSLHFISYIWWNTQCQIPAANVLHLEHNPDSQVKMHVNIEACNSNNSLWYTEISSKILDSAKFKAYKNLTRQHTRRTSLKKEPGEWLRSEM